MASDPDFLERLWLEVVNIDPKGRWLARSMRTCKGLEEDDCAAALQRLGKSAAKEDLGRISRFVRYETCFSMLYALSDPGLPRRTLPDLIKAIEGLRTGQRPPKSAGRYVEALNLSLSGSEDAGWLLELAKKDDGDAPFADVGPAVKRALSAGAAPADLVSLVRWSSYEAAVKGHELLQESGLAENGEIEGLHELFLGSDPSGKEGRPGSWPVPREARGSAKGPVPLWKVRSGSTLAFSADGKKIAIAGESGPARIYETATGRELVVCEGIKAHIYRLAFSPDGSRLAINHIYYRADICDASTGKLIAKTVFPKPPNPEAEVSGLVYSNTGHLLRSAWKNTIDVIDGRSLEVLGPLGPLGPANSAVFALSFFPEGKKLAALWSPCGHGHEYVVIWSWPEREVLCRFSFPQRGVGGMAISPDGNMIAVTSSQHPDGKLEEFIYLYDANSGARLREWRGPDTWGLVFASNTILLIAKADDFFVLRVDDSKPPEKISFSGDGSWKMGVSPCGKYLCTVGWKGTAVWELASVMAAIE